MIDHETTATYRFLSFNNSYRHVPCGELENEDVHQTESTADTVAVHMSALQQDSGIDSLFCKRNISSLATYGCKKCDVCTYTFESYEAYQ